MIVLCEVLAQTPVRPQRESILYAFKNITHGPLSSSVLQFLLERCDFETILRSLYAGYASIAYDDTPNLGGASVQLPEMVTGTDSDKPVPAQVREADLIRTLLSRIKNYRV
eukprot:TRINITY_DN14514_c0_g1_i2.p1 TRINITY_DN14514_c0_g1~~TRINITY_DN14514_c0_g1_i2.p1  ORF type:complete len:111 (-),score=18.20 TRINITY_DN14514_c0_g1_i2:117-449(-)